MIKFPGPSLTVNVVADIDECIEGSHNCDDNAMCNNIDSNFTCACNIGYSGDGLTCTGICLIYQHSSSLLGGGREHHHKSFAE